MKRKRSGYGSREPFFPNQSSSGAAGNQCTSYIPRTTLESVVGLLCGCACKCIVTLADRGRKEGEVTKSDALLLLLLLRISANRARERRNAEPTAMQVANRFFARRNSRGVTSWLASPAAGPGGRGRTVAVCQARKGGREGGAPPLAKPVRRPSIRHALSRAQSTINCRAAHSLSRSLFLELLPLDFFSPYALRLPSGLS